MVKLKIALFLLGFVFLVALISCADTDHTDMAAVRETCEDAGIVKPSTTTGAGGGAGGQGGTGGMATLPECRPETVANDCTHLGAPDPRCGSLQCIEDKCVLDINSGPIESQKYGDCRQAVCDDTGNVIELWDALDVYNDGNQCTIDYCTLGEQGDLLPTLHTIADGMPCPEAGEGYCYQGKCVECVDIIPQANCKNPGQVCDQIYCEDFTPQCAGTCGGNCAPCAAGGPCAVSADCQSEVCTNGMCQAPTCTDGVKNDGETGIDCGANSCPLLCQAGEGCVTADDCQSGVCKVGICQAPSCTDATLNGDETGIDCGGSCLKACVVQ